ncbi:unnamed protein product [Ambrosiozyma monospora]|uniref:Unnamed protein product n=1 Tax=Ambrosiozyma monospora TaxID=43982 RepID=A0ACB5T397_AMBMO|nr:unnamed protein product [Ambrosiozyma monospora]
MVQSIFANLFSNTSGNGKSNFWLTSLLVVSPILVYQVFSTSSVFGKMSTLMNDQNKRKKLLKDSSNRDTQHTHTLTVNDDSSVPRSTVSPPVLNDDIQQASSSSSTDNNNYTTATTTDNEPPSPTIPRTAQSNETLSDKVKNFFLGSFARDDYIGPETFDSDSSSSLHTSGVAADDDAQVQQPAQPEHQQQQQDLKDPKQHENIVLGSTNDSAAISNKNIAQVSPTISSKTEPQVNLPAGSAAQTGSFGVGDQLGAEKPTEKPKKNSLQKSPRVGGGNDHGTFVEVVDPNLAHDVKNKNQKGKVAPHVILEQAEKELSTDPHDDLVDNESLKSIKQESQSNLEKKSDTVSTGSRNYVSVVKDEPKVESKEAAGNAGLFPHPEAVGLTSSLSSSPSSTEPVTAPLSNAHSDSKKPVLTGLAATAGAAGAASASTSDYLILLHL